MKKKKFLVVNDSSLIVELIIGLLKERGMDASGIMPTNGEPEIFESGKDQKTLIGDSNVIFLDHNMPIMTGDKWLKHWKSELDFSEKIIIGTSTNPEKQYGYVDQSVDTTDLTSVESAINKIIDYDLALV
jgi:CheY-like chemotaxis protein